MNTKAFSIGFTVVNTALEGVSTCSRGIVASVQATKNGARDTAEVVTSFFAGASQAWKYRRGTCRVLTHDVRRGEEE